jgi:hypothetical protein
MRNEMTTKRKEYTEEFRKRPDQHTASPAF